MPVYPLNMLLTELVDVSRRLSETSSRSDKAAIVASALRRLEPGEIVIGVAYLAGNTPQGRIGLGWSTLEAARKAAPAGAAEGGQPAESANRLKLADVDRALQEIAGLSGSGSTTNRKRLLAELFRRASADETDFLTRLIMGELRQGALEGIMEEAIAKAAEIPASEIRQAAMLAGELTSVARSALVEGRSGLEKYHLQLFRPVQPMLAQRGRGRPRRAGPTRRGVPRIQARRRTRPGPQVGRRGPGLLAGAERSHPGRARDRRAVRSATRAQADSRRRGHRPQAGRTPHPFQTTMRRFGRRLDVERLRGGRCRSRPSSST